MTVIISPNPATQNSTIQIKAETDFTTAVIFDISGREILQTTCNSNHTSINMAGLTKGIYLLQLNGKENAKAVRKIIIQ